MRLEPALEASQNFGMPDDLLVTRIGIADDLPAGVKIGPRQQSDERAILPGHQRVLHHRRRRGDGVGAKRSDMHEGAGRQLEILDHPAGKNNALQGVLGIDEHAGIADAVKPFLVERRAR